MRVEHKEYYYFEELEKGLFTDFLCENKISMNDFAKSCGISPSLLSLVVSGKRAITKNTLDQFAKQGFKVELWQKLKKRKKLSSC